MKLRHNNKSKHIQRNRGRLGRSIEECPSAIETRKEFLYWEIDTVIGRKTKDNAVLLKFTKHKTRNNIIIKMADKTSCCTMLVLENLQMEFDCSFYKVFKTIISNNSQKFADLSMPDEYLDTKVF